MTWVIVSLFARGLSTASVRNTKHSLGSALSFECIIKYCFQILPINTTRCAIGHLKARIPWLDWASLPIKGLLSCRKWITVCIPMYVSRRAICQQCNSRSDAVKLGVWSWSTLFATHAAILGITKTRLFKYIENFTFKNWKFSDKKNQIIFIFLLKS